MRKIVSLLTLSIAPSLFAIDGTVLINQSTVLAAGGFPYRITQPGSYKLSGNLVAPAGLQAILFTASDVTLDLNGFTVSCTLGVPLTSIVACVGDLGVDGSGVSRVRVRNGVVTITQTVGALPPNVFDNYALAFSKSQNLILEDLIVNTDNIGSGFGPHNLTFGANSIVRHNILSGSGGGITEGCPSLIEGNVNTTGGLGHLSGADCVLVNNVGIF